MEKLKEIKTEAQKEGKIQPSEILQEILPLLEDYFVGAFKAEKQVLEMQFLNGQKFRLMAEEVLCG